MVACERRLAGEGCERRLAGEGRERRLAGEAGDHGYGRRGQQASALRCPGLILVEGA